MGWHTALDTPPSKGVYVAGAQGVHAGAPAGFDTSSRGVSVSGNAAAPIVAGAERSPARMLRHSAAAEGVGRWLVPESEGRLPLRRELPLRRLVHDDRR